MLRSKLSIKSKQMLFGVVPLALLFCAAMVVGVGNSRHKSTAGSADIPVRNERAARRPERADARRADRMSDALLAMPQSSAQFDLLRNVIAGGGGTSSAGSFILDGTVGEPAAGTVMSGGNFAQAGGFWYAITSGALPSPTATPTPTPTPNFIVNSTDDAVDANPGDGICETMPGNRVCTLRAAIQEASSGNTIGFNIPTVGNNCAAGACTITLTNGELLIDKSLTINGPGANLLTVTRSTAGGTPDFRIFDIAAGTVALSGFTISNGVGVSPNVHRGGGIYDTSTDMVTITNVTISGNSTPQGQGGAISIDSTGTLNVTNSIISGNSAAGSGGGISNNRGTVNVTGSTISNNDGGGILNDPQANGTSATLTVTNSTISGNTNFGLGGQDGGIFNRFSSFATSTITVTVTNSTISGNSTRGIWALINAPAGSGMAITLNITNSTISGNTLEGIFIASAEPVTVNVTNSTISGNRPNGGVGGIDNSGSASTVNVKNSIIAGNGNIGSQAAGFSSDLNGTFISQGYNLIGNGGGARDTGFTNNVNNDQVGSSATPLDPKLGPLQNNGGPTFTHALLPGSPAIDKGSAATGITTDQRGLPRPVDDPAIPNASGGNGSDIGAFEVQAPPPSPTPTPTPTPTPSCVNVSVPTGQIALKNTTLTVPVNAGDTMGKGIISFDFTLAYDASVLTPLATPFDQTGTLSSGFTITTNSNTPGQLVVSGFGTAPLNGIGTLLKFKFNVTGSAPACSNLNLSSFHFNEGTPCASTTNGQMCVNSGTISGSVNYGTASGPAKPVPGVTLSAAGTPSASATTDSNGAYSFSGLGNGPYTVTPSKSPEVNGITSFDAALVAQSVVGLITLTPNQQIGADVSNNGTITSFDAALIAQTAVGLPNQSIAGTWKFVPSSRTYPSTAADQPNQNYDAILLGDVSGNWTPAGIGPIPPPSSESAQPAADPAISVSLPNASAAHGASISIPITSGDLSRQNVISYDLDLAFDPNVLQPQSSPASSAGTLSNDMNLTVNTGVPGHVRVAAFRTSTLSGAGSLLNLNFTVVGAPGATTPLTVQSFEYNEGSPRVSTTNGQFSVVTPSAANGTIGGTITDSNGAPISGATIHLSGTESRETITDSSGNYNFLDVETNGFYTVTPARANYTFSPPNRSFSMLGVHTEASFTASANGDHANAIDTTEFFVRQQYLDFLGREPDPPGFIGWVNTIKNCASGDTSCDRVHVSEMFFRSQEFQERGYFIYRFYSTAFGQKPDYAAFVPDLARVSGFLTNDQLEAAKTAFTNDFVTRPAFSQYNSLSNAQYVDALSTTAGVTLSNRRMLIDGLEHGTLTRAQVLRQVAESGEIYRKYYNQAFVVMEYFGYLRRDPDILYLNWIDVLNQSGDSRHMVTGFVNSLEYRQRFGP